VGDGPQVAEACVLVKRANRNAKVCGPRPPRELVAENESLANSLSALPGARIVVTGIPLFDLGVRTAVVRNH